MLWEAMKTDLKREGHAEGLAEGRLEGHAEGLAEGRLEGRAEGLAEGKNEEKYAIAKRMLALGRDLQDIMLFTDLPMTQIHKLQAELNA